MRPVLEQAGRKGVRKQLPDHVFTGYLKHALPRYTLVSHASLLHKVADKPTGWSGRVVASFLDPYPLAVKEGRDRHLSTPRYTSFLPEVYRATRAAGSSSWYSSVAQNLVFLT